DSLRLHRSAPGCALNRYWQPGATAAGDGDRGGNAVRAGLVAGGRAGATELFYRTRDVQRTPTAADRSRTDLVALFETREIFRRPKTLLRRAAGLSQRVQRLSQLYEIVRSACLR